MIAVTGTSENLKGRLKKTMTNDNVTSTNKGSFYRDIPMLVLVIFS